MSVTSRRRRATHRKRASEAQERECARYVAEYERIERQRWSGVPPIGPLRLTLTDTINIQTGMRCIGGAIEEP